MTEYTYAERGNIPDGAYIHYESNDPSEAWLCHRPGTWIASASALRCDDGGRIAARESLWVVTGGRRYTYAQRHLIPNGAHLQYIECPIAPSVVGIPGTWDASRNALEYDVPQDDGGRRASMTEGAMLGPVETPQAPEARAPRTWSNYQRRNIPDGTRVRVTRAIGHREHLGKTGTWRSAGLRFELDPGQFQTVCRNWDEVAEILTDAPVTQPDAPRVWTKALGDSGTEVPVGTRVRLDEYMNRTTNANVGRVGTITPRQRSDGGMRHQILFDGDEGTLGFADWTQVTEVDPVPAPAVDRAPAGRQIEGWENFTQGQRYRVVRLDQHPDTVGKVCRWQHPHLIFEDGSPAVSPYRATIVEEVAEEVTAPTTVPTTVEGFAVGDLVTVKADAVGVFFHREAEGTVTHINPQSAGLMALSVQARNQRGDLVEQSVRVSDIIAWSRPTARHYERHQNILDGQRIRIWQTAGRHLGHVGLWNRRTGLMACETCGGPHALNNSHTFAEDAAGAPATPDATPATPVVAGDARARWDALWADMGRAADQKSLCRDYDRFAERVGGPLRPSRCGPPQDVTLTVNGYQVTVRQVPVPHGVSAQDTARQALAPSPDDGRDYEQMLTDLWPQLRTVCRQHGLLDEYDEIVVKHGGPPRVQPSVAHEVTLMVGSNTVRVSGVMAPQGSTQAALEVAARAVLATGTTPALQPF